MFYIWLCSKENTDSTKKLTIGFNNLCPVQITEYAYADERSTEKRKYLKGSAYT